MSVSATPKLKQETQMDYKVLILAVSNQASQADNVLPYESAMEMVREYLKDDYKLLSVDFLGSKRILGNSTNAYEFAWHFLKA